MTIIIDLKGKNGDQVLEEYRLRSSIRWGTSPLRKLQQMATAMRAFGITVSELNSVMLAYGKAITPEMIREMEDELARRKRERMLIIVERVCAVVSVCAFMFLVMRWIGVFK